MHYNVSMQVFSWCAKTSYIWCIITLKSRFSHDAPKTLIFEALLRGKADFLMTHQKLLYLKHYYVEKQFSHDRPKKSIFLHYYVLKQVFSWRNRTSSVYLMHYNVSKKVFSWRAKKVQTCCLITWKSRFSHDRPKKCIFFALLRVKAGFLMMCQKLLYLIHYYVEKQVFSWRTKKVQIYCIMTFRSRFSHDALKTLIFDAILRGKAGFLMTRQKVQTCCLITWKSRFSHDAPKTLVFVVLLCFEAGFLMTRQNLLYFKHYFVEKQVFSWHAKNVQICCNITFWSKFSHDATVNMHSYVEKQVFSWRDRKQSVYLMHYCVS